MAYNIGKSVKKFALGLDWTLSASIFPFEPIHTIDKVIMDVLENFGQEQVGITYHRNSMGYSTRKSLNLVFQLENEFIGPSNQLTPLIRS